MERFCRHCDHGESWHQHYSDSTYCAQSGCRCEQFRTQLGVGAKYRADMNAAIKTWPWWDRPLVRFAIWLTEKREGAPDKRP